MSPARKSLTLLDPSIRWLMWIAVTCLAVVLGFKVFFDNLQDELSAKSANERARLFVGEEIVRGIQGVERDLYLMAAASNRAALRRIDTNIDKQLAKLHHDLLVLKEGGAVRREMLLNIEGRDAMVREEHYRPVVGDAELVMEMIEIGPLLDQIKNETRELERLLTRSWNLQERGDHRGFLEFHDEIDAFLKHIPPNFARLTENANRLFFDSSARLDEIEAALERQRVRLKQAEMGVMALVMLLAGLVGMFFLRRINVANRKLEDALDEMRAAKESADRASRAKSEFVSRMSHELRTPLNAIIGFADLLEAEPLSPSHKNYVTLINGSGKHLLELINAVLDHAKIEAGGLTLENIPYDFHAAIDAVQAIVGERASSKGLEFDAVIAPDMPRHVVGDPTRLRQVLINLLVNAVKFTEQGSVELRIAPDAGRLLISVSDTGIGMDEQALGRLFKPFSQADDSVTRKYGGTGLGLLISKELIEAMGGSIEVESTLGSGTTFRFWLPLQAAESGAAGSGDAAICQTDSVAGLVQGKVLVVDDNRVNLQLTCAMLDRLGIQHATALDGVEALSRLASAEFVLVLMDMEMPVMDGITATHQLRDREAAQGAQRVPVIAMTANALTEDRDRCFAAGMDGYIAKPVNLAALQSELRRLFGTTPAAAGGQNGLPVPMNSPAPPLFDRAAAIENMGDAELFDELAGMFVVDAPNLAGEVEVALAAADAPRLARAAHTLKGLFATFVSVRGETVARQLEQTARAGDLAACSDLATKVCALTGELAVALQTK
jgi:signal transduction histidine kinase/CheY-like chemotaxis protein/HPt (histidine-containing phosphotransfer) domain-containing protein